MLSHFCRLLHVVAAERLKYRWANMISLTTDERERQLGWNSVTQEEHFVESESACTKLSARRSSVRRTR